MQFMTPNQSDFTFHFCCFICRKSAVNVIDAKTMSPNPVAVVELPKRVPYGFHAFFVTEVSLSFLFLLGFVSYFLFIKNIRLEPFSRETSRKTYVKID